MDCDRFGCRSQATLECSSCNAAFFCSKACAKHAWSSGKHGVVCGERYDDDDPEIYTEPAEDPLGFHLKIFQGVPNELLLYENEQRIMEDRRNRLRAFIRRNQDVLRVTQAHPISPQACEKWINKLETAAMGSGKWFDDPEFADTNDSYLTQEQSQERLGNKKQMIEQVQLMANLGTLNFARFFCSKLQYVPFRKFKKKLFSVVEQAIQYAEGQGMKVALLNYYNLNRSMSWIVMLIYEVFMNRIDALCMSFAEVHAITRPGDSRKTFCLIVDDASYSGAQLAEKLGVFVELFQDSVREKRIEYGVAVPYITQEAKRNIEFEAPGRVQVFLDGGFKKEMRTAKELMDEYAQDGLGDYFDEPEQVAELIMENLTDEALPRRPENLPGGEKLWLDLSSLQTPWNFQSKPLSPFVFGLSKRATWPMVYFDHKLADRHSTPNFLIAQAPYPEFSDNKITINHIPLMEGCEDKPFRYETSKVVGNDFLQKADNMCPFPPYKDFKFEGAVDAQKTHLFDLPPT